MPLDEDDLKSWFERPPVIFSAGTAAIALVIVLIFAVMKTSQDSMAPAESIAPPATSNTSESWTPSSSTTTSYPRPSVQTSEQNLVPPAPPPPVEREPTDEATAEATDTEAPTTPTTIFNPYVTTTPPLAAHV